MMLCQLSYVKLLLHPLFLGYIGGYLLVIHILSCYDAHDKIVHVWEKKIRSLHTIYLTYNISVPEMFNELKDVR